jgi:hypothetical protein
VRPTLVLSDLHLQPEAPGEADPSFRAPRALLELLAQVPGADLVLAGDIFDFTLLDASLSIEDAARRFGAAYPELFRVLGARAERGQRVCFIPGNHDRTLNEASSQEALRTVFGPAGAHVSFAPWFLRLEGVHIEHGNQFDEDNTFVHPLGPHNPETEPLGTALMRRFVAPNRAHIFAHGHTTTLMSGLRTALAHFGPRAPLVIVNYFRTALGLVRDTGRLEPTRRIEAETGRARLAESARALGLSQETLEAMAALGARPRHDSWSRTWMRLYFDRVLGALAALGAAGLFVSGSGTPALASGGLSGLYLLGSWLHARERYGQGPSNAMADAARAVRALSDAELVLFGHSHEPRQEPGYINLGSFTFAGDARRYVLLDTAGRPELGQLPL